jgi:predicted GNAT family acetyltransferase
VLLAELIAEAKPEEVRESEIAADKQPAVAAAVIEEGRMVAYADGPPWGRNATYADIGVLCHPDCRGRGHAVRVAARVALDVPAAGLIPIYNHADWNVASQRVAEKLGFRIVSSRHAYRLNLTEL